MGVAGSVDFPWEIILLMKSSHDNLSTRLFIKKIKYKLAHFCNMKLVHNFFTYNDIAFYQVKCEMIFKGLKICKSWTL